MSKRPKITKREVRVHAAPQRFEIRKNADGSRSISGYAATFGDLSQDLGNFQEVVRAGAFKKSLRDNPDVLCLYGHDDNQILGRVASRTLTIAEDSKGLKFTCKLPDTSTARDLIALMERGDISQMSFGFSVPQGGDDWKQIGDQLIRTLNQVRLYEISVVVMPAYTSTSVNLRSCPIQLRSKIKLKRRDDDDGCDPESPDYDPDSDDCEDEDRDDQQTDCDCDCEQCEGDNCADCSNMDCESDACMGCGIQNRSAHMALLIRRLRS